MSSSRLSGSMSTAVESSSPLKPLFSAVGSVDTSLSDLQINEQVIAFLDAIGPKERVMILPPDFTRYHSQAGKITQMVTDYYNFPAPSSETTTENLTLRKKGPSIEIMPALGTHKPMTDTQIRIMFGEKLADTSAILVHDWRNDVETIGYVPASYVEKATYGKILNQPWPAQLNKRVWDLRHNKSKSLVLSIGQVVPHEVMGMANFNKNLFVGVGGADAINLSHFIGAIHGMERMMGRAHNPLRDILNYASEKFLRTNLDIWYILTVMGKSEVTGSVEMKGLFIGNDIQCYDLACELSMRVNFTIVEKPLRTVVAYMDPNEFQTTWVGNKAIYRTRMAMADGGTLIVLAPGVDRFGEDDKVDSLMRRFGYVGTPKLLQALDENEDLRCNLSCVAHLIHGSTEGRFRVVYCSALSKSEVEKAGFEYGDVIEMMQRYNVETLKDGWNVDEISGEEFYFLANPALGLWAVSERFENPTEAVEGDQLSCSFQDQTGVDGSGGVGGWARPPTD